MTHLDRAVADPVLAELTGPDGRFEIVREDVLGVETQVYRERMRTLRELVAQSAARADLDFVVQGDEPEDRLTFGAHDARARAVAASLAGLGVGVGDRVALCSANNPDWVVTFWACALVGAVLVPLNAWWKAEELEFGLNDSEAKVLICDERRIGVLRDSLAHVSSLEHVFVIAKDPADARPFSELADGPFDFVESPLAEDDLLAIIYTSGTTGRPKGATLTHRQVIANLSNIVVLGVAAAMRGAPPRAGQGRLQSSSRLVVPLFPVNRCLATLPCN